MAGGICQIVHDIKRKNEGEMILESVGIDTENGWKRSTDLPHPRAGQQIADS